MSTVVEYDFQDLQNIAKTLLDATSSSIICFYGAMGTGKTTLIKIMLKELGVVDQGSSPTFGLVNEYHDKHGNPIAYHFDFYRINALEEALDLGLEEYFARDAFVFLEWPEKIEALLPKGCHKVSLYFVNENTRRIEF